MGFGPAQGAGGAQPLSTTDSPTFAGLTLTGNLDIDSDAGLLRLGAAQDVILARDAANAFAQRNGTSAQTFRIYNTFTNASNHSRLAVQYNAGDSAMEILTEGAGTGSAKTLVVGATGGGALYFKTSNNYRWFVSASGHFLAQADNTFDVGASGATRPRTGYFGTSVLCPEFRRLGSNGQYATITAITESHTLAAAATSNTTIQIPAGAMVLGVDIRVTTEITGCDTLDVGVTGATTRYGTGIALTAGTTNATCATVSAPTIYQSATAIRFSAIGGGASFTAGVVRVTVHYLAISAATS